MKQRITIWVADEADQSDWIDLTAGPEVVESAIADAAGDSPWEVWRTEAADFPYNADIGYLKRYAELLQRYDNELVKAVVNVCLGNLDEAEAAIERMFDD